jgi:hypothetical protein
MRAAIRNTGACILASRAACEPTRMAVSARFAALAELAGHDGRPPLVALAETLRQCESIATANGDSRLALILRDARGEASAHAAYQLGVAA